MASYELAVLSKRLWASGGSDILYVMEEAQEIPPSHHRKSQNEILGSQNQILTTLNSIFNQKWMFFFKWNKVFNDFTLVVYVELLTSKSSSLPGTKSTSFCLSLTSSICSWIDLSWDSTIPKRKQERPQHYYSLILLDYPHFLLQIMGTHFPWKERKNLCLNYPRGLWWEVEKESWPQRHQDLALGPQGRGSCLQGVQLSPPHCWGQLVHLQQQWKQ